MHTNRQIGCGLFLLAVLILFLVFLWMFGIKDASTWIGILAGILISFVAAYGWWLATSKLDEEDFERTYKDFEGIYGAYLKGNETTQLDLQYAVEVTIEFPDISIKSVWVNPSEHSPFYGSFQMNQGLSLHGNGYYNHENLSKFGFLEVQLVPPSEKHPKRILVHSNYFSNNTEKPGAKTVVGYVWLPLRKDQIPKTKSPNPR